ncbi:hypothetical protein, partial [Nonomuraea maheshkhaliensis]|uniref:hypothetical protein n=1 Tax=Nonomuraea maheshkhaliensis TaxID=419590 RepID=UPI0031F78B00
QRAGTLPRRQRAPAVAAGPPARGAGALGAFGGHRLLDPAGQRRRDVRIGRAGGHAGRPPRQQFAHAATFLQTWDGLTSEDQAPRVITALQYLRVVRRASLDGQADVAAPREEAV